jgi:hypothetical protein
MKIKTIQEVLKEYTIELKSETRNVIVYTCKRTSQKNKLTSATTRLNAYSNADTQNNFSCRKD